MSDAIIVRRGSTERPSPNLAVLRINAPVGSTITLVKGGVTVATLAANKGHMNADDSRYADWYYSISSSNYGSWTVTATRSDETISQTVTIDSVKEYNVELTYDLYLLKYGVFQYPYQKNSNYLYVSFGEGYVRFTTDASWTKLSIPITESMLQDRKYKYLNARLLNVEKAISYPVYFGISSSATADHAWLASATIPGNTTYPEMYAADLSTVSYSSMIDQWFKFSFQSYPLIYTFSDVYLTNTGS